MIEEPLEQRLAREFHVPAHLKLNNEEGTFIGSYHLKGTQYFVYVFDRGQPVYATLKRSEVNEHWLNKSQKRLFE